MVAAPETDGKRNVGSDVHSQPTGPGPFPLTTATSEPKRPAVLSRHKDGGRGRSRNIHGGCCCTRIVRRRPSVERLLDGIGDVGRAAATALSLRHDTGVLRAIKPAGVVRGERSQPDGGLQPSSTRRRPREGHVSGGHRGSTSCARKVAGRLRSAPRRPPSTGTAAGRCAVPSNRRGGTVGPTSGRLERRTANGVRPRYGGCRRPTRGIKNFFRRRTRRYRKNNAVRMPDMVASTRATAAGGVVRGVHRDRRVAHGRRQDRALDVRTAVRYADRRLHVDRHHAVRASAEDTRRCAHRLGRSPHVAWTATDGGGPPAQGRHGIGIAVRR